jgi:4-hydroxybenzoate polyprenyltransferase
MTTVSRNRYWSILSGLAYEIRPWQWYKQSLLLLGLVFSKSFFSLDAWTDVTLGIVAFCLAAGGTYIFNDINDIEEDRRHPEKQYRPIASGQVPVPIAAAFGLGLLILSLVTAWSLGILFLTVLLAYLGQNVIYTLYLKQIVIADVTLIATGFVLRAIAGTVAIDVTTSPWLIVCTFLAALLLALGKRRHEYRITDDPAQTRSVLNEYTAEFLDQLLTVSMSTLLVSYSLYTFFQASDWMMLTIPFAFYTVFRYLLLVRTSDISADPAKLFADRPFVLTLVLWAVVVFVLLLDGSVQIS